MTLNPIPLLLRPVQARVQNRVDVDLTLFETPSRWATKGPGFTSISHKEFAKRTGRQFYDRHKDAALRSIGGCSDTYELTTRLQMERRVATEFRAVKMRSNACLSVVAVLFVTAVVVFGSWAAVLYAMLGLLFVAARLYVNAVEVRLVREARLLHARLHTSNRYKWPLSPPVPEPVLATV